MASIISAGTSSGTSLNLTGDTSGVLQLASNNGTTAVTIDTSQNVGIGVTPSAKLEVKAASASGTNLKLTQYNSTDGWTLIADDNGGPLRFVRIGNALNGEAMRIDNGGNLLVGATSSGGTGWSMYPTGYAITNGSTSTFTHISFQTSSSQKGYIQTVGGTTNYNGSSDYRLKENVIPLPNALQTVAQLKPVKFNWKEDNSVGYSFIAHELQEVVPQAVGGTKDEVDKNGKPVYQGVDPSKLVCFLTAAIQEQQAIIQSLTDRIEKLEAK